MPIHHARTQDATHAEAAAIWALRRLAQGPRPRCAAARPHAVVPLEEEVSALGVTFSATLGASGVRVSADERLLLGCLAAAQDCEESALEARLSAAVPDGTARAALAHCLTSLAASLAASGHWLS